MTSPAVGHVHLDFHPGGRKSGALHVVVVSALILAAVAGIELVTAWLSASAAVLADGFHNLGDVSTTAALGFAFTLSRRAPTSRFPYGYHRSEDLAAFFVVMLIIATAIVSGVTSVQHLLNQQRLTNFPAALAATLVAFAGNEVAAQYKIGAGKRLQSVALLADGRHSRIDGLASLAAAAGIVGAHLGAPILDPVAGLMITAVIAYIGFEAGASVMGRLLDASDATLAADISESAAAVPGVASVARVRPRWIGRRLIVEMTVAVDGELSLNAAHEIGEEVRHHLHHRLESLDDVIIHLDPAGLNDPHRARTGHRH